MALLRLLIATTLIFSLMMADADAARRHGGGGGARSNGGGVGPGSAVGLAIGLGMLAAAAAAQQQQQGGRRYNTRYFHGRRHRFAAAPSPAGHNYVTVERATELLLRYYYNCTNPNFANRVVATATHGFIRTQAAFRAVCNSQQYPVREYYYMSQPDFLGTDSIEFHENNRLVFRTDATIVDHRASNVPTASPNEAGSNEVIVRHREGDNVYLGEESAVGYVRNCQAPDSAFRPNATAFKGTLNFSRVYISGCGKKRIPVWAIFYRPNDDVSGQDTIRVNFNAIPQETIAVSISPARPTVLRVKAGDRVKVAEFNECQDFAVEVASTPGGRAWDEYAEAFDNGCKTGEGHRHIIYYQSDNSFSGSAAVSFSTTLDRPRTVGVEVTKIPYSWDPKKDVPDPKLSRSPAEAAVTPPEDGASSDTNVPSSLRTAAEIEFKRSHRKVGEVVRRLFFWNKISSRAAVFFNFSGADGGNAVMTAAMEFVAPQGRWTPTGTKIPIADDIESGRFIDDRTLILKTNYYLPDDPHCCASGHRVLRIVLGRRPIRPLALSSVEATGLDPEEKTTLPAASPDLAGSPPSKLRPLQPLKNGDPRSAFETIYNQHESIFFDHGKEMLSKVLSKNTFKDAMKFLDVNKDDPVSDGVDPFAIRQEATDYHVNDVLVQNTSASRASVRADITIDLVPGEKPTNYVAYVDFVLEDGEWRLDNVRNVGSYTLKDWKKCLVIECSKVTSEYWNTDDQSVDPNAVSSAPPLEYDQKPRPSQNVFAALSPVPKPTFEHGLDYAIVRQRMLASGFQPFQAPGADTCDADDPRCIDRPEMEACSGTGAANCKFLWKKGATLYAICTIGEAKAVFDDWCSPN